MNAIDILAHACDIEGFPRVVIEAIAAGKPVVGPRAGGVAEGVGEEGSARGEGVYVGGLGVVVACATEGVPTLLVGVEE